jgi:O-antigen ligase
MLRPSQIKLTESYKFFILLFSFFLPVYPKILPPLLILTCISIILYYINEKPKIKILPGYFLFPVLFFIYFGLALLAENKQEAFFDLEVKLSFLALPLVFVLFPVNQNLYEKIHYAFSYGTIVSMILLFSISFFYFLQTNNTGEFFYVKLGRYYHPSYLSMYIVYAMFFMISEWLKKKGNHLLYFSLLALVFLILLISKAGLFSTGLLIVFTLWKYKNINKLRYLLLVFISLSIISSVVLWKTPVMKSRFIEFYQTWNQEEKPGFITTTSVRKIAWREAWNLWQEKIWFGWFPGDAKEKLLEQYEKKGFYSMKKKKYNVHNQYLETALATGLAGLSVLLFSLIYFYRNMKIRANFTGEFFILLVSFHFLFESMLQTQAGVLFFVFFYLINLKYEPKENTVFAS